jgi:hypothetical protein
MQSSAWEIEIATLAGALGGYWPATAPTADDRRGCFRV